MTNGLPITVSLRTRFSSSVRISVRVTHCKKMLTLQFAFNIAFITFDDCWHVFQFLREHFCAELVIF